MKKIFVLFVLAFVCGIMWAQNPTYQLLLMNDTQVSSTVYEFNIYILRTGSTTFELASLQMIMKFNTGISSGTLTLTMNSGTSELNTLQQPTTMSVSGDELRVNPRTPPGAGSGTVIPISPGYRVGRFRVTSSVPFSAQSPNVDWKNVENPYTKVFAYVSSLNTEITDSTGHDNLLQNQALPIQLASSSASVVRDKEVEINWRTVSETNNYGFEIERKRGEAGVWKKLGFVEGHGTTLAPQSYTYLDTSVSFEKHFYRIKQIDLDGKSETFPDMEVSVGAGPDKFVLAQNYPNPFNPTTVIEFAVPKSGHTTLKVFNLLGQEMSTLFDGNAEAGEIYTTLLEATKLASGIYFYRLHSAGKVETKRMLLLK